MTSELKLVLLKRVKSFLWRLGGLIVVALLAFIGEQLELFNLPLAWIALITLFINELTKFINSNLSELGVKKNIE